MLAGGAISCVLCEKHSLKNRYFFLLRGWNIANQWYRFWDLNPDQLRLHPKCSASAIPPNRHRRNLLVNQRFKLEEGKNTKNRVGWVCRTWTYDSYSASRLTVWRSTNWTNTQCCCACEVYFSSANWRIVYFATLIFRFATKLHTELPYRGEPHLGHHWE